MKFEGIVITYAPEEGINKHNYFLNGITKDDVSERSCAEEYQNIRRRNLFGVSDASDSEVMGDDIAYITVHTLNKYLGSNFSSFQRKYFAEANEFIRGQAIEKKDYNISVSIGILFFENNFARAYNIGDVSILHYRQKQLKVISGKVPEKVQMEKATVNDNAIRIKRINKKTIQHFGYMPRDFVLAPYASEKIRTKEKDIFIILTKDVLKTASIEEITGILDDTELSLNKKAEKLFEMVVGRNPQGNFTIQFTKIKETPRIFKLRVGTFFVVLALILCTIAETLFGNKINESVISAVERCEIFFQNLTKPTKKSVIGTEPWVPIALEKKEDEEPKADLHSEESVKKDEEKSKPSNSSPVIKPVSPAKPEPSVTDEINNSRPDASLEENEKKDSPEESVSLPEDLPPVQNTEAELPIDFS